MPRLRLTRRLGADAYASLCPFILFLLAVAVCSLSLASTVASLPAGDRCCAHLARYLLLVVGTYAFAAALPAAGAAYAARLCAKPPNLTPARQVGGRRYRQPRARNANHHHLGHARPPDLRTPRRCGAATPRAPKARHAGDCRPPYVVGAAAPWPDQLWPDPAVGASASRFDHIAWPDPGPFPAAGCRHVPASPALPAVLPGSQPYATSRWGDALPPRTDHRPRRDRPHGGCSRSPPAWRIFLIAAILAVTRGTRWGDASPPRDRLQEGCRPPCAWPLAQAPALPWSAGAAAALASSPNHFGSIPCDTAGRCTECIDHRGEHALPQPAGADTAPTSPATTRLQGSPTDATPGRRNSTSPKLTATRWRTAQPQPASECSPPHRGPLGSSRHARWRGVPSWARGPRSKAMPLLRGHHRPLRQTRSLLIVRAPCDRMAV